MSRARFLQIAIYYISIFLLLDIPEVQTLFTALEIEEIKVVAEYCAIHYVPYMLASKYGARYDPYAGFYKLNQLAVLLATSSWPSRDSEESGGPILWLLPRLWPRGSFILTFSALSLQSSHSSTSRLSVNFIFSIFIYILLFLS